MVDRTRLTSFRLNLLGSAAIGISLVCSGCSLKRMAINQVGNALAGSGGTFSSDDDPQLIREAVPFSLKLMESLLAESPRHEGLLFALASGFTQYAYAFVQQDADRMEEDDVASAESLRDRARRLYLRARDYGLRGLEEACPGFGAALEENSIQAVARLKKKHVPLLFWTASAWGALIGLSKDDPVLIAEQVIVESLIDRMLALDESFGRGSIHVLLISYEMVRQGAPGNAAERSRQHFERALALSGGKMAGPYVAYAEAVAVQNQDHVLFEELLTKAIAIDPDALPDDRLVNLIFRERAQWLLSRKEELFLFPNKL